MRTRTAFISILAMLAALLPGIPAVAQDSTASINEIRIDQSGADNDEYFELTGEAGEDLTGLTYLVIGDGTGGSGVIEEVTDLAGQAIGPGGFFVAAESTFTLGTADFTTSLNFENSDNVTHLLVEGFTGSDGADLDTDDDGTLDTTPWSAIVDSVALIGTDSAGELVYSDTTVGPDGTFVPGHVFFCDSEWMIGAFDPVGGQDTPGAANDCEPPPPPVYTDLTIPEIQGATHTSPHDGELVRTSGVVTAVSSGNGYYLQDPAGDADAATSDAIFVFDAGSTTVAVGDAVTVEGAVSEFTPGGVATRNLSTTEIVADATLVDSSGNPLPAAVIIGSGGVEPPTEVIDDDAFASFDPATDGIDFFEAMEAMRVTVKSPTTVAGTTDFGEIFTVPKGVHPTHESRRGTLNIGPDDYNPERVQIDPDDTVFAIAAPVVDTGAMLSDVTGVIGYSFGNFEVVPTETFSVVKASKLHGERTDLKSHKNHLTVATYNVLNLDPNDTDADTDVADGRFQSIAHDIVYNLRGPDVVALEEIQDNTGSTDDGVTSAAATLQMLVDEIVADGGPHYEYIDNPFIGNNTSGGEPGANIRVAFLYNPDRVDTKGVAQTVVDPVDQQTNPSNPFWDTRLPLVQTFEFEGRNITMVANHFASKSGSAPLYGTEQNSTERQEDPTVNGSLDQRRAQAEAVNDYLAPLLADEENIVVLGDFNEFEFISPLQALSENLENLTFRERPDERYSYVFEGNSQSLDHILVSEKLSQRAKFDAVHINAEFAATPARSSDHDPLVTSLDVSKLPQKAKPAYTVYVLHNNDGESDLLPDDSGAGSISRFGELLQDQRRKLEKGHSNGVLTLTAGDNFLASPEFSASLDKGAPYYDSIALDYLEYDSFTIGNHEFDFGPEVLANFIDGIDCEETPFLSANLIFDAEPALADLVDRGCIEPSTTITRDGHEIGIIGLTTPDLAEVSSPGDVEILDDLAEIANAEAEAMTNQGVDIIILASHLQNLDNEVDLAASLHNIDAIVGGGGGEELTQARTAITADGVTIPIATVPGDYFDVGRLELAFDGDGKLIQFDWDLVDVTGDLEQNRYLLHKVEKPVTDYVAGLDEVILTNSPVGLNGVRADVRAKETNLGNLMSDAFVQVAQARAAEFGVSLAGPIVGLENGGGIRNDSVIGPGNITLLDSFDIAPFSNFVSVITDVSPADLVAAVEHGLSALPGAEGFFGQWSGLVVEYDPANAAGSRVLNLSIDGTPYVVDGVLQGGLEPVDLASIDFLAAGNDGYDMFEAYDFTTLGTSYQQALADILETADLTLPQYQEGTQVRIIPLG